jgi:REase_AHJR-like
MVIVMDQQNRSPLQHQRLLKLAKEYRDQGYKVTLYPSAADLPPSLVGCALDLIAVKGKEAIAAEVRTKDSLTLNGSEDLKCIAEQIQRTPGWRFELVVTNPRKKSA